MVIYIPVKFELIGQSVFELESGNENVDGQTNELTELHQYRKQPSYDGNLSPCEV